MAQNGFTNLNPPPVSIPIGYDINYNTTAMDSYPVDGLVTNNAMIAQRIARLLITPTGALSAIDPDPNAINWGIDCRQFVNGKFSRAQFGNLQSQITNAILQDEQVANANVNLTIDNAGNMGINVLITTAVGPFSLTLSISNVTAAVVFEVNLNP